MSDPSKNTSLESSESSFVYTEDSEKNASLEPSEHYFECIEDAIEDNTLRLVLTKMIDNNDPEYQYLQDNSQRYRIFKYLDISMYCNASYDDIVYIIEKYDIQEPLLLNASIETCREDIFKYLLNCNKNYFLHKDYQADVGLVISAIRYNASIVNKLILDYKIDIWNPPKGITMVEHLSRIWPEAINEYRMDFIKTFIDHGADINISLYGNAWTNSDRTNLGSSLEYHMWYTPLTYAIGAGNFDIARYLISRGAEMDYNHFLPAVFAAVRYSLDPRLQQKMIDQYNGIDSSITRQKDNYVRMRSNLLFVIQHGANPYVKQGRCLNIHGYIDKIMDFTMERHAFEDSIIISQEKSAKFRKWHEETIIRIKNIVDTTINDALGMVKLNKKIVAKSMDVVMKLMVMSNQIRSNQILSGNILGIVMDFHGGLGDELNPESLRELEILLDKRQFLLSHKKHYEKLGFLEEKGGILCQKEGDLGQKKCDLPAIDVRNEQNMGTCTEEVCKNVQKTVKNSTFLNNLDAVKFYLSEQHHNVRSVAFNTMSAMLDDTLIAQAEWYVHEGRALNTFAAAVTNGDVTVISGPSAISEAIRIAEIAVSPDSEANLGRESTSHITVIDEAPNDDIIVHSDNILSQAMDLIHDLHFDTALTSTTPYAL